MDFQDRLQDQELTVTHVHADAPGLVTFHLPERDLDALRQADPDRDWRLFMRGERAWILQTYLRLKQAGFPVELSDRLPDAGVVVISGQRRKALSVSSSQRKRLLIVATVQDLSFPAIADVHLVQDPRQAGPVYALPVRHWPQPGLQPRSPQRGARIERVAFKGTTENLHPSFRTERWTSQLSELGVTWVEDAAPSAEIARDPSRLHWNDYREIDLALAVRPPDVIRRKAKPASKLITSWLARCPALLGPEPAFRALRRGDLDYVEIETPEDALRAIAALKNDPARYLAMIENGATRSAEFSTEQVTQEWAHVLFRVLPELQGNADFQRWRRMPVALRRLRGLAGRV
jgi:hypothetical protein